MSTLSTFSISERQTAALNRAQTAADAGDAAVMFQGLCESMIFEGYKIYFGNRYSDLRAEEIDNTIGEATDEVYNRVKTGKKVRAVHSYLWKVIDNKLSKCWERKIEVQQTDVESIGTVARAALSEEDWHERDRMKDEAVSIALKLVPRLGNTNIEAVMRYIIESAKNGVQHIDYDEIADALGLSRSNVKTWVRRGFERLTRLAREENLVEESFKFPLGEEADYFVNEVDTIEPEDNY